MGNARFFENIEFAGGDRVRDFIFKDGYVDIPMGAISIDKDFIPDFVQNTINQDNVREPPNQKIIPEEQTLPPQEPMPLKRSTRERRTAIHMIILYFFKNMRLTLE